MDSRFCTYKRVGYLKSHIANMIGIDFTGIIYASPGVLKHINKTALPPGVGAGLLLHVHSRENL